MLENTKSYQELEKRQSKYKDKIEGIFQYAVGVLPKINHVFANYTGHAIEHSVSVMDYMYDLIADISEISDLDRMSY